MIYVLARSQKLADDFLKRHSNLLPYVQIETGHQSCCDIINYLIETSTLSYVCIVQEDVSLSTDFIEKIKALVQEMELNWPNWGIVGNGAQLPMRVGYNATDSVRCFSDPEEGPNLAQHILPAQIINAHVILLNIAALQRKKVCLPKLHNLELHNIILSIETIKADLGVYVAPQLACWQSSIDNSVEVSHARKSKIFNHYLCNSLRNIKINTPKGIISIQSDPTISPIRSGIDLPMASLRSAVCGRNKKTVAIVTRTQFARPKFLARTIETVAAFIANAGATTNFHSYIVTNSSHNIPADLERFSTVLRADIPENIDSRYLLVHFAAKEIKADYFWFVDDDDWLFPNEAERLSLIVNVSPPRSIIFLDSQHFMEKELQADKSESGPAYISSAARYFPAQEFLSAITGVNYIPFCGILFERESLLNIPMRAYETITYLEDFTTTMSVLLTGKSFPIIVNKLFAGVSIRESGNTVTEKDRTKWNKSTSEMWSYLLNSPNTSFLLTLPIHVVSPPSLALFPRMLKVLKKIITGELTVSEFYRKVKYRLYKRKW